jgi:hypothetical protein
MREAEMLARQLKKVLREGGSSDALHEYGNVFREEWEHLLGIDSTIEARKSAARPLVRNSKALLSCLPGSADDLQPMLNQLGFDLRLEHEAPVQA